ncbi:hypothetical protein ACFW04_012004 [Cataglyphis niger]
MSETWLRSAITDAMIRLPGYFLFRCDIVGRSGGGMAFYLADHLRVSILCCSGKSVTGRPEFIMAEILFNDRSKLLLAVVYRSPNSGYLNKFFQSFLEFQINYRHSQLGSFIFASNLYLVPFMSTYHLRNSSTLLDLCIINDRDKLKEFGQRGVVFLSAHDLIFIRYGIKLQRHGRHEIRLVMRNRDLARRTWRRHKNDVLYDRDKTLRNKSCAFCKARTSDVWSKLRHLSLIKARDTGVRLSHFAEEFNAFFGHKAEYADYMEGGGYIVRMISRAKSNAVGGDGISLKLLKLNPRYTAYFGASIQFLLDEWSVFSEVKIGSYLPDS